MIFWLVWGFCNLEGALRFTVAVDGVVVVGCEVVGIGWLTLELWLWSGILLFGVLLFGVGWCEGMDF